MQVIYIDTLFLTNLVINYIILLSTSKICAANVHRIRLWISAGFGALYSVAVLFPALAFLLHPAMKIASGIAMSVISFGGKRQIVRITLVMLAVSAAFGGAVYAVTMLTGVDLITAAAVFDFKVLILSFIVCYAILIIVFRRTGRNHKGGGIVKLTIEHGGRKATVPALVDTGNSLSDPLTGASVAVADVFEIKSIFPREIREIIAKEAEESSVEAMENLDEKCNMRFRLVPYNAIGVKNGLLLAFRPDKIAVNGEEKKDMIIALSPTAVSDGGAYAALIGA